MLYSLRACYLFVSFYPLQNETRRCSYYGI
nr:MAG TPA: hypothetical protein [Crassvirales sp.]